MINMQDCAILSHKPEVSQVRVQLLTLLLTMKRVLALVPFLFISGMELRSLNLHCRQWETMNTAELRSEVLTKTIFGRPFTTKATIRLDSSNDQPELEM